MKSLLFCFAFSLPLLLGGCAHSQLNTNPIQPQRIVVSVQDQLLVLLKQDEPFRFYSISTSRFGVGEKNDSDATPTGRHQIAEKIGDGEPIGMVFESRVATGEIVQINEPGRWPVVTRILRLAGIEKRNENTFERMIYIHGSPVERLLGKPASSGCIRMRSSDVVELFQLVDVGTSVEIIEGATSTVLSRRQLTKLQDHWRGEQIMKQSKLN
jgi:hypothetical protein